MSVVSVTRRIRRDDRGFSLPEMIVYMLLLVVVLGIVGSIIVSSQRVESRVRVSTQASTSAQLAADSVETGIRNSRAFSIVDVGEDQLLIARTVDEGQPVTWSCTRWFFDKSEGTLRTNVVDPATPSSLSAPTAAQLAQWTLLTSDIRQAGSTRPFTIVGTTQLTIKFETGARARSGTVISSSADSRAARWESAPCF
jgi:type II secretory pathway pseudopilin PulG